MKARFILTAALLIFTYSVKAQCLHYYKCSTKSKNPSELLNKNNDAHVQRYLLYTSAMKSLNNDNLPKVDEIVNERLYLKSQICEFEDVPKVLPVLLEGINSDVEKARAIYKFINSKYSYNMDPIKQVYKNLGINFTTIKWPVKVNVNIFNETRTISQYKFKETKDYELAKDIETNDTLYSESFFTKTGGTCVDYSRLFASMAQQAGLNVGYLGGYMVIDGKWYAHAWNYIIIDKVKFYVDVTNDIFLGSNNDPYLFIPYYVTSNLEAMGRYCTEFNEYKFSSQTYGYSENYTLKGLEQINSKILQDYTLLEQNLNFGIAEYKTNQFTVFLKSKHLTNEIGLSSAN